MKRCAALLALTLSLGVFARADDIQFTTLPQVVQTTVVRETHIPDATLVTRVVRENGGIYAVTVRQNDATRVVYVNEAGAIVDSSTSTVTTTTTTEPAEQEVLTYEQVKQNLPRYELIEKKGNKEVYLDHQTGQKVKVQPSLSSGMMKGSPNFFGLCSSFGLSSLFSTSFGKSSLISFRNMVALRPMNGRIFSTSLLAI
jgi:hypothetical protein